VNQMEDSEQIFTRWIQDPNEIYDISIRHLMKHTGELMERLGTRIGAEIDRVRGVHR
jgi:hypothetical protein